MSILLTLVMVELCAKFFFTTSIVSASLTVSIFNWWKEQKKPYMVVEILLVYRVNMSVMDTLACE